MQVRYPKTRGTTVLHKVYVQNDHIYHITIAGITIAAFISEINLVYVLWFSILASIFLVMPRLFTVLPDMPLNPSSISSNFIFGPITDFKNSKSTKLRLDPVSNKQIVFFPVYYCLNIHVSLTII